MKTFPCKIELAGPLGALSVDLEVGAATRAAIEWLMLGAQRDSTCKGETPGVTFEHSTDALTIRIDKKSAMEVFVARRIS
ncbi:hypothetical protein [Pseudomonas sp. Z1-6]|uniref:hypothetical protein n=1 Tax=Pseudomonas sp. Z1-6 TaxID=2817407 RepID=UPI003DA9960D